MINASSEQIRGLTGCVSTATVGIGGTAAKCRLTAPNGAGVDFAIDGLGYHLADTDDFWTMSGDTVADDSECLFLLCVNASGTMSIEQGTAILTADLDSGKKVLPWPQPDADVCPLGAVRVTTDGAAYIPGTTDLDASTVTDTYYNFLLGMPAAPLTS